MAVQFTQASTDKVAVSSPFSNSGAFSFMMWVKENAVTGTSEGFGRDVTTSSEVEDFIKFVSGPPAVWILSEKYRATTWARADVTDANLFPSGSGVWQYIAGSYDPTDGPRVYVAVPGSDAVPVEPTYDSRVVGVGASGTNNLGVYVGNRGPTNSLAPPFDIARFAYSDYVLSAAEHAYLWLQPAQVWAAYLAAQTSNGFVHDYHHASNTVPDLMGQGNTGTCTGLALVDHPPILIRKARRRIAPQAAAGGDPEGLLIGGKLVGRGILMGGRLVA